MSDIDNHIVWSNTIRRRDRYVHEAALDIERDQPIRTRLAKRIAGAIYLAARRLPSPISGRIFHGWDTALDRPLRATLCRTLGHSWYLIVAGDPYRGVGHLAMCHGCSMLASTDDPDLFHPGSRARRDFGAFAFELDAAADTARYVHPWPPRQEADRG